MAVQERTVWGIHAGKAGDADRLFLQHNCIAVGWREVGTLSSVKADRKAFAAACAKTYPNDKEGTVRAGANQLYRFVHEMKKGDYAVYPSRIDKQIHIGRVEGEYKFSQDHEPIFPHRRPVKWLATVPRTRFSQGALYESGAAMTLFQIRNFAEEFIAAVDGKPAPLPPKNITVAVVSEDIEQSTTDFIKKRITQDSPGHAFTHLVAHVLNTLGYHTRVSPEGPDHGIDIVAHKDELGLQPPIVKVQCKSTEGSINEETVSALYGRVTEKEYALFVTLGSYNKGATGYARGRSNLRLIDGDELVELILEHYEEFDTRYKSLLPLKRVYIPDVVEEAAE